MGGRKKTLGDAEDVQKRQVPNVFCHERWAGGYRIAHDVGSVVASLKEEGKTSMWWETFSRGSPRINRKEC